MKVRALRNGDIEVNGVLVALFIDQVYDLAEPLVQEHDWLEVLEPASDVEPEAKEIEGPPADKAVRSRRTK